MRLTTVVAQTAQWFAWVAHIPLGNGHYTMISSELDKSIQILYNNFNFKFERNYP